MMAVGVEWTILQLFAVLIATGCSFVTNQCISPQITNPGISCENEVCHNKVEFFEQYDTVSLTVYFKGNGPFNVSWFFNHRLLLPPVINTSKKDIMNITIIDNPWDHEGYYTALISNMCGYNQSIFFMEYYCLPLLSGGDIDTVNNVSVSVGDRLMLSFNFTAINNLYICFTRNLTSNTKFLSPDMDHNCIKCLANFYSHRCDSKPNITNNTVVDHGFQASFYYSACPSSYLVHFYKFEMSFLDSGSIIYAKYTGESYTPLKIIRVHVGSRHYSYVIYIVLSGIVVMFVGVTLFILWLKKKRSSNLKTVDYSHPPCKFSSSYRSSPHQLALGGLRFSWHSYWSLRSRYIRAREETTTPAMESLHHACVPYQRVTETLPIACMPGRQQSLLNRLDDSPAISPARISRDKATTSEDYQQSAIL